MGYEKSVKDFTTLYTFGFTLYSKDYPISVWYSLMKKISFVYLFLYLYKNTFEQC